MTRFYIRTSSFLERVTSPTILSRHRLLSCVRACIPQSNCIASSHSSPPPSHSLSFLPSFQAPPAYHLNISLGIIISRAPAQTHVNPEQYENSHGDGADGVDSVSGFIGRCPSRGEPYPLVLPQPGEVSTKNPHPAPSALQLEDYFHRLCSALQGL
jgi:hypothetical protein